MLYGQDAVVEFQVSVQAGIIKCSLSDNCQTLRYFKVSGDVFGTTKSIIADELKLFR